jgi:hypothetical protein
LLNLCKHEIFVDRDIEPAVTDALRLYEIGVPPRDAMMLISALNQFMVDGDMEKLKLAHSSVDVFSIATSKLVGHPVEVRGVYTVEATIKNRVKNKKRFL